MHLLMRQRARRLLTMLLLPMMLASCSGNTNSTGPASPLPTGQNGSLKLWTGTNAGCYVLDDGSPCAPSPSGTNPITAVSTVTSGFLSPNYLLVGDSVGNLTAWSVPNSSSTTPSSSSAVPCGSTNFKIQGVAAQYGSSSSTIYVVSSGTLESFSLTTSSCTVSSSSIGTTGSVVGLALADGYVYGIPMFHSKQHI